VVAVVVHIAGLQVQQEGRVLLIKVMLEVLDLAALPIL
jgi:hypothetical protein